MTDIYSNKITKKKEYFLYLVFFSLESFSFFNPVFIDRETGIYNKISAVAMILLLPSFAKNFFSKDEYLYTKPLKMLIVAILISIFSAYFYWGQSIIDSFYAIFFSVAGYFIYYFLHDIKVTSKTVEKLILYVGTLFMIVFILSFVLYPTKIVAYDSLELESRGFQRILINGAGFLFLLFFMALNKVYVKQGRKWVIILVLSYICILLSLTRLYILGSTLIAVVYMLQGRNVFLKVAIITGIIALVTIVPQLEVFQTLVDKTQSDLEVFKDYIRIQSANYYLGEFQPSFFTQIFGNGINSFQSNYGKKIMDLNKSSGFFIEDLGLIGLYINFGVLALVAYFMIFWKSFRTKMIESHVYTKMYIWFILFCSLTNYASFSGNFVVSIVLTLYLIEMNNVKSVAMAAKPKVQKSKYPMFATENFAVNRNV
jgi:hypothetical protein